MMSESATKVKWTHTPGPWKMFHDTDFQVDIYGHESKRATTHVASIWLGSNESHIHENKANARLIAKAPEMAELLREVLPTLLYERTYAERKELSDRVEALLAEIE